MFSFIVLFIYGINLFLHDLLDKNDNRENELCYAYVKQ